MRKAKTASIWLLSLLGVYVLSYAVNSLMGGYWLKPDMDGRDRYASGLSMFDAVLWQPRWGYCARGRGRTDLLGSFYRPMIWLDRALIHRTIYLFDDGGFERASSLTKRETHPAFYGQYDELAVESQPDAAPEPPPAAAVRKASEPMNTNTESEASADDGGR